MGASRDPAVTEDALVAASRSGDEGAFAVLVERHRGELRMYCYRMVGSFDDSEDLVQETFLRAWRHLHGFEGRSTIRAWLYRIATNACLDALRGRERRALPHQLSAASDPSVGLLPRTDIAWLQPFPDHLIEPEHGWEPAAPDSDQPEVAVVTRETIELAFLAAMQHLPPRQRAVLILHDVLGWPARQTAALLETSVPSVNSALQRARSTLRSHLPERRLDWTRSAESTAQEREVLRRYVNAVERADLAAVAELLAADVRASMPPYPMWFLGRDAVMASLTESWDPDSPCYVGRFRVVPIAANRQPAGAAYVRGRDDQAYRPFAISVMRIEGDRVAELTAFHDPAVFAAFGVPAELAAVH